MKWHVLKCHIFNVVSWNDVMKYLQKKGGVYCTHFSEIVYVLSSKYPANKTLRNTENKLFHVNVCLNYFCNKFYWKGKEAEH